VNLLVHLAEKILLLKLTNERGITRFSNEPGKIRKINLERNTNLLSEH
jgi:hypothetical protein